MKKRVIKFWASWCSPCSTYSPTFEKIKQELQSDQIEFIEIDVENDPNGLVEQYKVRGIPHTVVVEQGADTRSRSGVMTQDELKQFIVN